MLERLCNIRAEILFSVPGINNFLFVLLLFSTSLHYTEKLNVAPASQPSRTMTLTNRDLTDPQLEVTSKTIGETCTVKASRRNSSKGCFLWHLQVSQEPEFDSLVDRYGWMVVVYWLLRCLNCHYHNNCGFKPLLSILKWSTSADNQQVNGFQKQYPDNIYQNVPVTEYLSHKVTPPTVTKLPVSAAVRSLQFLSLSMKVFCWARPAGRSSNCTHNILEILDTYWPRTLQRESYCTAILRFLKVTMKLHKFMKQMYNLVKSCNWHCENQIFHLSLFKCALRIS